LQTSSKEKQKISIAWIDYAKAYDSIPHSWLIEVLNIYKIHNGIINFLKHSVTNWLTKLYLSLPTIAFESQQISIKRRIFQGDSWSPLWFCLAMS
jgi:hypothetical protein